jgi:hypothetical protein
MVVIGVGGGFNVCREEEAVHINSRAVLLLVLLTRIPYKNTRSLVSALQVTPRVTLTP